MSETPCREGTCVAPEMCEELGHCTSLSKEMEQVWKGTSIDLSRMLEKTKRELAEANRHQICDVCLGEPLPSGKKCVCGGAGTLIAALTGTREALHEANRLEEVFSLFISESEKCPPLPVGIDPLQREMWTDWITMVLKNCGAYQDRAGISTADVSLKFKEDK
jgi:hypothetical protein